MINAVAYVLISFGVLLNLLASIALLRFTDTHGRLLGSTKYITFGVASIMAGVFLLNGFNAIGVKALLCAGFILLTSPVEAHVLARSVRRSQRPAPDDNKESVS